MHVPRGHHRVRLVFLPQSFVIGRTITLVTLVLCGGWLFARGRVSPPRSDPLLGSTGSQLGR